MKKTLPLVVLAGALFAVSFFLPAYEKFSGFDCFQICCESLIKHDSENTWGWIYYAAFMLDNLLFVLLFASLFLKNRCSVVPRVLVTVVLLHLLSWFALNVFWHGQAPGSSIKFGYYVWLAAYILLAVLIFKRKRESSPG